MSSVILRRKTNIILLRRIRVPAVDNCNLRSGDKGRLVIARTTPSVLQVFLRAIHELRLAKIQDAFCHDEKGTATSSV